MYPPNLNVPLPDPSPLAPEQTAQQPSGIERALPMITSLFGLGTALGGSPRAGAALLAGSHQALTEREKQRSLREHQQQQLALQQQQAASLEAYRMAQIEAKRQQDIQEFITGTQKSLDGVTDRNRYEQTLAFAENMGQQFYGLRPNTLRSLIPYRAPDAKKNLYDAVDKYLKNPANKGAIESGAAAKAAIQVDTDGDGVPDKPVPLGQAISESGYPVFLDPETQKPILSEKPLKPENVEPFDLAYRGLVDRFRAEKGRDPSDQERGTLAVQAQRSLDKPAATGGMSGGGMAGGLTPEGIEFAATQYRVTGVMPPMGMGGGPERKQIINAAAAQARALNQSPVAAIQKQAAFKADSAALQQMRRMQSAARAYESKAMGQADIVADLSSRVTRSQWPILNRAIMAGQTEVVGDPTATQLINAITTFSTEYAKIMEGSTGSAQASTESARKAATRLINGAMSKGQISAVLDLMKREMDLTLQGYDATINGITERQIGGTGQAPAASSGGLSVVAPNGKTYTFSTQEQLDAFKRAAGIK